MPLSDEKFCAAAKIHASSPEHRSAAAIAAIVVVKYLRPRTVSGLQESKIRTALGVGALRHCPSSCISKFSNLRTQQKWTGIPFGVTRANPRLESVRSR
jgi:hypothetical protein